MRLSLSSTVELLKKWRDQSSPLFIVCDDPLLSLKTTGRVKELAFVGDKLLGVTLAWGDWGEMKFMLAGTSFRSLESDGFVTSLAIDFESGAIIALFEKWLSEDFLSDMPNLRD
jgi:hypothetical protein